MRINDQSSWSYVQNRTSNQRAERSDNTTANQTQAAANTGEATPSRSDRIEQLRQQMSQGKPIDVNKLADAMIQKGALFDEQA